MGTAYPGQTFQDRFTQQWAIFWGRRINPEEVPWLMGPFGGLDGIGDRFISKLAADENLIIERETPSQGLLPSIQQLNLSESELSDLSQQVIDFYEKTARYALGLSVKWNPLFKPFGLLLNRFFSDRINQLNIPLDDPPSAESIKSEIITLSDSVSKEVKYTIWFRTDRSTGQVIYSGVYSTCTLPAGKTCIKAVFPLPKGNATVILRPRVGSRGELILESPGNRFGDPGFYFLLNDSKGDYWSYYIRSFRDQLIVAPENETISAIQTMTLWRIKVLRLYYQIKMKK